MILSMRSEVYWPNRGDFCVLMCVWVQTLSSGHCILIKAVLESLRSAPVAQLDRVPGYEPGGREFESLRARNPF